MMKNSYFAVLFILISGVLFAQQGRDSASHKYALVIGNAEYQRIEKLNNTLNDARDIGAALRELGYQVELKSNLSQYQMIDAVDAFVARLNSDRLSEGFFWYAGHAVQIRDENYLLPVDITIDSESRVRAGSYSLNALLDVLEGARNKVNVIVLDSCRDNPLPTGARGTGARGLTVIQDLPPDLFIMFSTAPGNKAEDGARGKRNSPFAEAFLKHIKSTEPLTIMAAHVANETLSLTEQRQRPFYRGSIISDIYYSLNSAQKAPEPIAQVTPAPLPAPQPVPQPQPTPKPPRERVSNADRVDRLNTLGASVGTAFSIPWLTATVHGSYAPFKYSFFDLGLEVGLISRVADTGYYSVYPFAHYAFFIPFAGKFGWYAGAGVGFMFASYSFPEGEVKDNTAALDLSAGFILWNMLNISYTFRTNFSSVGNKLAVGYVKRFL
jgi:hypothetical protein